MADSSSPNPNIRTYAKDMAALSGKAAAPGMPAVVNQKGGERDAVLTRLRGRTAKEPVHENTLLPTSLPTPQPKAASTGEPTLARPEALPPSPPPPPPKVVVLAPQPPLPPPKPVPPPPPPVPVVPVTLSPIPQLVPKTEGPSPLHTYTSDFADRIDTKEASAFSVLAAQADSGAKAPEAISAPRKSRRGLMIIIAGIVLMLAGGIGVFAAYRYVSTHSVVSTTPLAASLVFADDRQALTGEGPQLLSALASSAASSLPEGQVRVVYLTQASTTADKKTVMIPLAGGKLFGALQLSAPDILLRNIAPESTIGIVHAGPETRAFFILKVLSYERTFAGMLQWEGQMQSSLTLLYPVYAAPAAPAPVVTTTTKTVNGKRVVATTTMAAAPVATVLPHFIDEVASNHDVRALKDGQGRTILLYGYKDKETLIIARDEAAFAELLNRLAATKQQ